MRKLALFLFSFPCLAMDPPPGLCAHLVASGVPQALIQSYFAPSAGHVYERLSAPLREKLIQASVAMMSMPSENAGRRAFAGESWGYTAVGHLWLLGVPQDQIVAYVKPLLDETYATRVAPGLKAFERGGDFREPVAPLPARASTGGVEVVRIHNGAVRGESTPFTDAILRDRDRQEIDRAFSETNPGILHDYFEGATLAGYSDMAEKILRYMIFLDKGDAPIAYSLDTLGRQKELVEVGEALLREVMQRIQSRNVDFHLRNTFASAVDALSRVTQAQWKPRANALLLAIAQMIAHPDFFSLFVALPENDLIDAHYEYYDIALLALQAMGSITARHYADSSRIELTFELNPQAEPQAAALIQQICDEYVKLKRRVDADQFHQVRRGLLAIGDSRRLKQYGERFFSRRAQWADDWQPSNVYESAFEFLLAGGDVSRARVVIDTLLDEFTFIAHFSREDRSTLTESDVRSWMQAAGRAGHATALVRFSQICEMFGWGHLEEKIAAVQAGDPAEEAFHIFPHLPQMPNGIGEALSDAPKLLAVLEMSPPPPAATRALLAEEAAAALALGDLDEAYRLYREARSAQGMIAVGDAFLRLHYSSTSGGGRHFGASAHGSYVLAAIFEAGN